MLCINPYKTGKEEFGCGKCLPCKFTKRRVWVGRIVVESLCHRHSCFVTLTYKDAPDEFSDSDVRLFFKRLRRSVGNVRYLLVGEKGSRSGRIHYHVALFGVSIAQSATLRRCWKEGFIDVGELNAGSAAYLVKYMLKSDSGEVFRRMSLKPGIGAGPDKKMVKSLGAQLGPLLHEGRIEDVPPSIRVGSRMYPVSRYVRAKVREKVGRSPLTPQSVRSTQQDEYASQCPVHRERVRENGYTSALCRLEIMKSKEKL